jgi:AcrR family transcriptional regulator
VSDRMVEILHAACRVIACNGADGLRMSDVAREAGVSSALVHYYFDTREELLRRAFLFTDDRADARVDAELALLDSPAERLEAMLTFYVLGNDDVARENAILWREAWSHAAFDPTLRDSLVESYQSWLEQLHELLEELAPGRADADDVVRRLAAIVDGLSAQVVLGMIDGHAAARLIGESIALEFGLQKEHRHEH